MGRESSAFQDKRAITSLTSRANWRFATHGEDFADLLDVSERLVTGGFGSLVQCHCEVYRSLYLQRPLIFLVHLQTRREIVIGIDGSSMPSSWTTCLTPNVTTTPCMRSSNSWLFPTKHQPSPEGRPNSNQWAHPLHISASTTHWSSGNVRIQTTKAR